MSILGVHRNTQSPSPCQSMFVWSLPMKYPRMTPFRCKACGSPLFPEMNLNDGDDGKSVKCQYIIFILIMSLLWGGKICFIGSIIVPRVPNQSKRQEFPRHASVCTFNVVISAMRAQLLLCPSSYPTPFVSYTLFVT